MKTPFFGKIAAAALVMSAIAFPAQAADIQITVNGQPLAADVPPTVLNNRTLLPLRACAEALNATVNYDPAAGRIDVYAGQNKIELTLNSNQAVINGQFKAMDVEPQILNDRTLVPLRFLGEALNAQVNWLPESNTVAIQAAAASPATPAAKPNEPVYLPDAETIANQALQQINNIRLQKNLRSLASAAELTTMAAEHSLDMGDKNYFSNTSPGGVTLSSRANAKGLPVPNELIAKIDYTQENVYNAVADWFSKEPTRSLLLDASAGYIGIAAYYQPGSTDVYLTAEIMPYRAYFLELPANSTVSGDTLKVRGRSQNLQEEITVYQIAANNPQMYSAKKTYTATGNGTYFYAELPFDAPGAYAIQVSGCLVRLNYVPASE